jgi:hypothetical protein
MCLHNVHESTYPLYAPGHYCTSLHRLYALYDADLITTLCVDRKGRDTSCGGLQDGCAIVYFHSKHCDVLQVLLTRCSAVGHLC